MNTKQDVQGFVSQKTIAMAGLSRDEKAISASMKKELQSKGYRILAVNPNAAEHRRRALLPEPLPRFPKGWAACSSSPPPSQSEKVVREAAAQGISRVWLQLGAQSEAAAAACAEHGLSAVSGKCILMFAEPVTSIHGVHRWFAKVFGQLPK